MRPPIFIRTSARSRRGAALVLFAVLVFALFAIAGVAIDVGTASLTQQQMQVAVDPAALEGVRLRDYNVYQHYSDPRRRPKVSNLVRLVFDDDLHPTGGTQAAGSATGMAPDDADALQLGAGPMLRITGQGEGPLAPSGLIALQPGNPTGTPTTPTWDDPILQSNMILGTEQVGNFDNGDMISGTFHPDQSPDEDGAYHRDDFERGVDGTLATREALGFLVRMRRTTGANPFDDMPGKSSRGPTIPFLWSLGSLMQKDPNNDWDPRRDGITVRATAIAVGRPALRASPTPIVNGVPAVSENEDGSPMFGLHFIALSLEHWASPLVNPGGSWNPAVNPMQIGANGALFVGSTIQAPNPPRGPECLVGSVLTGGAIQGYIVHADTVSSVGMEIHPVVCAPIPVGTKPGYVAIYAPILFNGATTNRVIGYGFTDAGKNAAGTLVQFRPGIQGTDGTSTSNVRVWVAANGVSANIGFDTPRLEPSEWNQIFAANFTLAYGGNNNAPAHDVVYDHTRIRTGTLLAPALAR